MPPILQHLSVVELSRVEEDESGFRSLWLDDSVGEAVELLSGQEHLHLFVGAGVSQEAGLPSWSELLDELLRRTALSSDPFRTKAEELDRGGADEHEVATALASDAASYSRWAIASHGLLGAAAVVKAWLGDGDYRRVVQDALYAPMIQSRLPFQPGPTAIAIAALWRRVGPSRMSVVTTNYDRMLERALVEIGVDETEIRSAPVGGDRDSRTYNVIHLHGVLPEPQLTEQSDIAQPIVLAEDEFFGGGADARMRSRLCESALTSDSCLFVGTSFTDPNLLGYLYAVARRERYDHKHVAIVVKQGEQPPQVDAGRTVLTLGRQTAAARLDRINVMTVQPSFFSQTAHVLGEIEPSVEGHTGFLDRLDRWSLAARSTGLLPGVPAAFDSRQSALQRALSVAVDQIHEAFMAVPSMRCDGEVLSLHLWAHDPFDSSIVFIARSDQHFMAPELLEREPIAMPIRRLVVESVCSGTVLEASGGALDSSRWNSMLVVPLSASLFSTRPGAPTIPIGALVLASSAEVARGLSRLRTAPDARHHLVRSLAQVGELMLQAEVNRDV
ncbi:MAG: SIR2 family protein [Actinomycetota bacterium]